MLASGQAVCWVSQTWAARMAKSNQIWFCPYLRRSVNWFKGVLNMEDMMTLWVTRFTGNPLTLIFICIKCHFITLPTSMLLWQPWHTASALCGTKILDQELEFLKTTFIDSGYSYKQIRLAFELVNGTSRIGTKPNSVALIPCVQTMFGWLSRLLTSCNIRSIGLPPGKISTFLWPVKDDLIWRHLGCIIFLLSVTRRTLVQVVIQLR